MPRLDLTGADDLIKAFEAISVVPESVLNKALVEMESIAADEIRASGEKYGIWDRESNVHVLNSVKINKPKKTETGGYADVTFSGTRHRGSTTTRNAEIAFINEYGKRNQQARPFIGEAMNKNADKIVRAGAEIITDWMENEFKK